MKTSVGIFLISYAVYRIVETFRRRPKLSGRIVATYSLPLIIAAYVLFYMVVLWNWCQTEQFAIINLGLGTTFVIASAVGRSWSIHALGVYHSIHIEIRDQHDLVQSGPYRFVRNPYYLSNIVEALGLALIVNCGSAWMIAALVYLPLIVHRLFLEQMALANKFKMEFLKYRAQVPSLIPKCLFGLHCGTDATRKQRSALRTGDL